MIGQTVSHYRITRQLGAGGMGVVYEAVDTKLDRTVALKFLPPESTRNPDAKIRFIHEAKAASALDHPNICTIHEIDTTDDGHLFIVMASYDGETLQDRIARGPLPIDEAVDITRQVAEGLAKAHEREIVHRDIKPANIFITTDGLVKILDFGLAKLTTQTMLTKTGTTLGTVSYLSPEQALGEATDQRTDLWSLGVVLYEMVTGRLPFVADHEQAIIYSILNMEPPPVRSLQPEVPGDLELVIFKCLAKDPNDRYGVPADLLQDLELEGTLLDTGARPPPRTISLTSGGSRNRARLRWLVPAILVMVVGIWSWVFLRGDGDRTGPSGPSLAIIDFGDLVTPDDLFTSKFLMGLLNTGLIENSPARVISSEYLHDLKSRLFGANQGLMGPGQALQVAREAGATFLLTGQIALVDERQILTWRLVDAVNGSNLVADRMEDTDLIELADKLIAASVADIKKTLGMVSSGPPVPVAQISTSSPEAYGHYLAGAMAVEGFRGKDAIRELHRAVEIDSTFALPYLALCQYWFPRSKEKMEENWNQAWRLRDRLGVKDLMRLELFKERSKDPVDYHHVRRIYEEMLERWPEDRELLRDRISVSSGDIAKKIDYAQKGLALYPDDLYFPLAISGPRRSVGDFEGSLTAAKVFVAKHPREPNAWDELGLAFLGVAMPDSAENAFRRALELKPGFWFGNRHLASQFYCRGDIRAAIDSYLAYLSSEDFPPSDPNITYYGGGFGGPPLLVQFYLDSGQMEKARGLFRAALADSSYLLNEYEYVLTDSTYLVTEQSYIRLLLSLDEPEGALVRLRNLNTKSPNANLKLKGMALVALDSLAQAEAIVEMFNGEYESYGAHWDRRAGLELQVQISIAKGDPEEALRLLDEIRASGVGFPSLRDIELRSTRAQALRQAGRPEEAAKVLKKLLRLYAGRGQAHCQLGKIYEETGSFADAKLHYEKFLAMWQQADEGLPQLDDTRLRLAALKSSE